MYVCTIRNTCADLYCLTHPLTFNPSQIDSLPLIFVVRVLGVCPVLRDLREVEVPQEVLHRLVHGVEGCAEACGAAVVACVLSYPRAGDCGGISSRPERSVNIIDD